MTALLSARLLALAWILAAPTATTPKTSQAVGLVVESVDESSPPGKAGIRAGDVLIGWERAANPPTNPSPARGDLVTPMDLEDVCIEETQRGALTLIGVRNGERLSFAIPLGFWDEFNLFSYNARQLPVHPRLEGKDLDRYLEGLRAIQNKDIDGGASAWRALALEWSQSNQGAHSVWLSFQLGAQLMKAKKLKEAQEAFDTALPEAKRLGMRSAVRQILFAKARAYWKQYDLESSLKTFAECRRISSEDRDPSLLVAEALAEEGSMLSRSGRPMEALESLQKAVAASARVAPGGLTHGATLVDLASCSQAVGDFVAAERQAREAKALMESTHRKGGAWQASDTLAAILLDRGDLAGADALGRQLLAIAERDYPGTKSEAYAAGNLGSVAFRRGDLATAEKYLLRDLALEEKVNAGKEGHAECLSSLGDLAAAKGDAAAAEGYYRRAFEIQQKLSPDSLNVTASLNGLGRLALRRGDPDAAASYYERALAIQEKTAPAGIQIADSLSGLAGVAVARGELEDARRLYERGLTILEHLSPDSLTCAETLHDLGVLQWRRGDLNQAAGYLRRAVDTLEAQKRKLGGTEEVRGLFAASHADYYRDYIEVLIELGKKEDAFRILERSRAQALLAMLAERDLVFAADVPADLETERKLANAAYDRAQGDLRESGSKDAEKQGEAVSRLRELRQKQEQIADRLKQASPKYAALQYPQPLDLRGTQTALDPGTLLLSYSVGKEKSFLFVVSPDPKRGPPLSVYTLPVGERALRDSVKAFRKLIQWGEPSPELFSRANSLYDTLLKPAEALVARSERLLILPDGSLHTLPWAALARGVESGRPRYLVEGKPVYTAISTTVLAELKKERRPPSTPAIDVAAFGDPRYPKLPERRVAVKRGEAEETPESDIELEEGEAGDAQVRSVMRGGFRFDPLPATRQEVEQIVRLYSPKAAAYLGEDATEEKARSIGKDVPLIHYACHAVVNERFPLDSALVFTIPDQPREGQDNGLLQAWEIFETVRIDANLVTLSACESGLGKEMGGEGLIGLTRAFQYAGARSVLASLWKVEDKATGELMKRFYTYLKAGKTKDEALRSAQIDLIHSSEFSQPKDWAAFQLNGDWK